MAFQQEMASHCGLTYLFSSCSCIAPCHNVYTSNNCIPSCVAQDIYCFVLPFVLKWVVAALVVSVLVDLFSKLTKRGDRTRMTVHGRVQAMVAESWQQYSQKAPSNTDMLLTFLRLNKSRTSLKQMPSFIRLPLFHTLCCVGVHMQ